MDKKQYRIVSIRADDNSSAEIYADEYHEHMSNYDSYIELFTDDEPAKLLYLSAFSKISIFKNGKLAWEWMHKTIPRYRKEWE